MFLSLSREPKKNGMELYRSTYRKIGYDLGVRDGGGRERREMGEG
jgi:hypothetical protein